MFGKVIDVYDNYVIIENQSGEIETNYLNIHVIFSDNEVWSCGLSGENKKKIGVITAKSDEEKGEYYVCSGIYVTDDYVVCDFERSSDYASERYMIRKTGGFRTKIY